MDIFNKVNPCRPGHGASCSFCCGSHNYKMDKDELESMFLERGVSGFRGSSIHPEDSFHEKVAQEGMQCVHMGIPDSEHGMIGCMAYYDDHSGSNMNEFFLGTCRTFLCEAWKELSDRDILFAAELMGDWYYYSLLINSQETLLELSAEYGHATDVPEDVLHEVKEELVDSISEMI